MIMIKKLSSKTLFAITERDFLKKKKRYDFNEAIFFRARHEKIVRVH